MTMTSTATAHFHPFSHKSFVDNFQPTEPTFAATAPSTIATTPAHPTAAAPGPGPAPPPIHPDRLLPTAHLSSLSFSLLRPTDTHRLSHLPVSQRSFYLPHTFTPQPYGVLDPHLGTSSKTAKCASCLRSLADCIGHYGHIQLVLPVFHIGYMKEIVRVLQAICKTCSRVLLSQTDKDRFLRALHAIKDPQRQRAQRTALYERAVLPTVKKCRCCPHCGAQNGVVKKLTTAFRIIHELRHKEALSTKQAYLDSFSTATLHNPQLKEHLHRATLDLSPLTAYYLFLKIPPQDCLLINFDPTKGRPQDMIITSLIVPPACIRPSVTVGVSGSNEDDLTVKLGDIIFINSVILASIEKGATVSNIVENWDFLQQQVAMYFNADLPGFPKQIGAVNKPIRALIQRLKGKQGRFRGNLSGKRVDFSSRTVISPDPNLRIDEVGVPELVAKILTFPERVNSLNIDQLRDCIRRGADVWPGANTVEYGNGVKIALKYGKRDEVAKRLRYGDLVERHIRDGDVVLFNRQPSLHRLSIMAHRARVLKWRTFRFNECVCSPYNADFDGDEMNLHVPQCFPESDTRVLTNAGFLFLDEIEARMARGEEVLYACYQKSTVPPTSSADMLKGEIVYRPGKLVYSPTPREFVVINSSQSEVKRWEAGSEAYGNVLPLSSTISHPNSSQLSTATTAPSTPTSSRRSSLSYNFTLSTESIADEGAEEEQDWPAHEWGVVDGERTCNRHVSLRITPQHHLYVQQVHSDSKQLNAPPEKVHASSLLSKCDCSSAQPGEIDCEHRRASVRMLACARTGRMPSATELSDVRDKVQMVLGLTNAQWPVFLELFGFWLGEGSMSYTPRAVTFCELRPSDAEYVNAAFSAVGLTQAQFTRTSTRTTTTRGYTTAVTWSIEDQRWFNFFDLEFGLNYHESDHYSDSDGDRSNRTPSRSDKWLPPWALCSLTPEQMRLLIRGLWRANSSWAQQKKAIATSDVSFRDQLMQLLLHCGHSPHTYLGAPAVIVTGYQLIDRTEDRAIFSVKEVEEEMTDEQQNLYEPIHSTVEQWLVTWAEATVEEETTSMDKAVCWPSMRKQESFSVQPYSAERDGRVWCVTVDHPEHLIFAQRAERHNSVVIKQSRPIIVGQSMEARIEALTLMGVEANLVTPRHGEPLVTATQDFITTSYLITQRDVFYDRSQISQIVTYFADANEQIELPAPVILKPIRLWTGKQVMSVLMRPNGDAQWPVVNVEMKERNYTRDTVMCSRDGYVVIRNSECMCGNWAKSTVGGDKSGLLYSLIRDHSAHHAAVLLNRLAKLSARWIGNRGFSIGIDDVTPSVNLQQYKHAKLTEGYAKCDKQIALFKRGELPAASGCNEEQTLEASLLGELSGIREELGSICFRELDYQHNSPLIMAVCGSKGSKINISQMISAVGQQAVSGNRIPNGFINRSLPHFLKGSREPQAKGFVENSFFSGLTATEFFFHTMGGREGLVDTAVKTAETGYMQRRLMKALEDLCVQYDETVRTSEGNVVQFVYGDDGLDPIMMTQGHAPVQFGRVMEQVRARSSVASSAERCLEPADIRAAVQRLAADEKGEWKKCSTQFVQKMKDFLLGIGDDLQQAMHAFGLTSLAPPTSSSDASHHAAYHAVTQTRRLTAAQLSSFLSICRTKYHLARIEPGTAVGAIGAQSIGEPGTQMTLKTFHFAGVASMNITLGVPRIKEIINAAKKISTPIITAPLVAASDVKAARIVKGRIEKTTLGEVSEYIEEVFAPHECYLAVKLDLAAIDALQLHITADSVVTAILATKKLKLKSGVMAKSESLIRIYPSDAAEEQSLMFAFTRLKAALPAVVVRGVSNVNRAVINDIGNGTYNLLVEGYNLLGVLTTMGVKGHECTSNHVDEMLKALGIEAARATIIREIQTTMEGHGLTIDYRHVSLLADIMCYRGRVLGITRFGVAQMKESVLMLASFEKTADHLFEAALRGVEDGIAGVSERIIMGTPIPVGTGLFQLLHRAEQGQRRAKEDQKWKRSMLLMHAFDKRKR